MVIIWGSKGKIKTKEQGQFHCPVCRGIRRYQLKEIGKYFTLYFVPLFKTNTEVVYVECQSCGLAFKPEVLND